jgi:mRNA interferase RelE/StbE
LAYKVLFKASVEKDLRRLDKSAQVEILKFIDNDLVAEPIIVGKPLKGSFKGYWSCRYGDYRIIYKVSKSEMLILVLKIAHRKDVYRD